MTNKIVMCIVGLMTILGLVLAGCGGEPEPEPGCPNITAGAGRPYLDEIVIQTTASQAAGIAELVANTTQLFATGIGDGTLLPSVQVPGLTYNMTFGTYTDLTFNPIGPVHPVGNKLNPFSNITVREAMNWLINREYICGTIMAGLGQPKYTFLNPFAADGGVRYAAQVANATAYYAHNISKAKAQVYAAMLYFNTTGPTAGNLRDDGNLTTPKWMYNNGTVDEWVKINMLVRNEDERKQVGEYVANLLTTELGFDYAITYGTGAQLAPTWQGDPAAVLWHIYTGGWASTVISRDEGGTVGQMFTDLYAGGPLWTAYGHAQPFFWAAAKLWNNDFANMVEREGLFNVSITGSLLDSVRVFVAHRLAFNPWRTEFGIMCDRAAGTQAGSLWAKTAHFKDAAAVWPYTPYVGGTLKASMLNLLVNPWNPVAGTNWVFDMFPIRATATLGTQPDGRDGLRWPERIQKGDVIARTGTPITSTLAWVNLTFVPANDTANLQAPLGAWCDWNATTQRFITVGERTQVGNPDYQAGFNRTVLIKTVAYYPTSLFSEQLHDGSKISVGDFMMYAILTFDRAKPASAIYDATAVSTLNSFMASFRAVRFTTDNPSWGLIVETWTNSYALDAENSMNTWWPYYNQGPGFWHTIALGIRAEAAGVLAFGQTKATNLGVEWTNFISGPSISRLKTQLAAAKAANYLPYSPTMGLYVNSTEIAERYFNLNCFVTARNNFWVNDGPFYLYGVDTTAKIITLKRFVGWEDAANTWMFMMDPLP